MQFDVKTAFLHGDLKQTIFVHRPKGYEDGTSKICELNKSLYGLKQAPQCWSHKIKSALEETGLRQSQSDRSLFCRNFASGMVLLIPYVNDGLVAATKDEDLVNPIRSLDKLFNWQNLNLLQDSLDLKYQEKVLAL